METLKKIWENPISKKAIIGLGGFILVIFIIIIAVSCTGGKNLTFEELEERSVKLAKKYYEENEDALPKEDKASVTLSLQTFVDNKQLGEISEIVKDSNSCRGNVKVTNNNGNYLYTPQIDCGNDYKSTTLADELKKNLVTEGNGLYKENSEYIFKGDNVNNYLKIGEVTYRILKITSDGNVKIIDTSKRDNTPWDDRYNIERDSDLGINDYITNGINSRLKDTLENAYATDYPKENIKPYLVTCSLCTGKRSETETINDGSIECSQTIDKQVYGLIQVNEFINASLDPNCKGTETISCLNYNYLADIGTTWTMTADKDTTYKAFRISSEGITLSFASTNSAYKVVTLLDKDVLVKDGKGTEAEPYTLK